VEREIVRETSGVGVDVAIVAAATTSSEPLLLAAEVARERGTLLIISDLPVQIPREPLYRKELDLRVSRSYGPGRYDVEYEERGLDYPIGYVRWTEKRNMHCVLTLQARGLLDLADLVEQVFPVDDAAEAYGRLAGERGARPRGALLLSYPVDSDTPATVGPVEDRPRAGVRHDRIRVGLIGPGDFARSVIIPAFLKTGARLEVVGGGMGPSAAAVQREFGFARVAASEEALIEDAAVDAVVICTRHGSHASLASAALEAGKHVFCEKPLAVTLDELAQLLDTAGTSDGILAVGFNRRFSPLLRELRAFVEQRASPLTAIYRVAAGHLPPANWQHDLAVGGGRIVGEACHFVDSLAYLTGAQIGEAHAVGFADDDKAIQARDNVIATLTHVDGSLGTILYAADAAPGVPKERIEVHSRSRSGTLDDFRTLELYGGTRLERQRSRTQQKGHVQEIEAFLAGVRAGEPPVPLAEIVNVSMATFAIVESLRTGRRVRIPSADSHIFKENENA
jgi:polar amino acid transport system substrate-binding protein